MAKTVYIHRDQGMGDVIWIAPLVSHYLDLGCKVTVVSRFANIFEQHPRIKRVGKASRFLRLKLRLFKLLRVPTYIDLNNSYEQEPMLHPVDAYSKRAGVHLVSRLPSAQLFLKHRSEPEAGEKGSIAFHIQAPSQKLSYRNVHGVDWLKLALAMEELGYSCVELVAAEAGTKPILSKYVVHGVDNLFAQLDSFSYFVGLDSGPSHVAQVLGKPSVIFYGSVNPNLRSHVGETLALQQPCDLAGCYHATKGYEGTPCVYENDQTTPPCCTFTTDDVLLKVSAFFSESTEH
ncbi:MAG: hypothetical protein JJ975_04625 [Bacteroidia bacterium]|nr:hypothetical protein [Bacteroidia bacterium]